jgi:hypothetical protein
VTFFTALYEADEGGQDEMHRLLFASDDDGEDADEDPPHLKKRRIKEEEEEDSQNQDSADLGDGEDAEEAEEDEDMEEPEDEEADGDGDSGDASGYGDPSASSKARQKAKASDSRAGKSVKGKKETAERRLLRKSPSDPQNPAKGITGKCQMCLKTSAKARSLTSHLTLHCMLASHITFSSCTLVCMIV